MTDLISRKDAEMCLTADISNMTIEEYISMVGDRLKELPSYRPVKLVDFKSTDDELKAELNRDKTALDELKAELENWEPELTELNHRLTFGECIIMAMSKITADLSEAAEKNWTEPQCEMLTRLICSVFMDKPYDEVTEKDMKSILEEQDE